MRRLLAAAALVLATSAGAARGDTFRVLASEDAPNFGGTLVLPAAWTLAPTDSQPLSEAELRALWQGAGEAYGIPWQVLAAINEIESDFGRNMGPSSAGAIGWMQFLPSTWLRWGMDADGDGVASPWKPQDAVYSAARYLAAAGGRTDLRRALYAYNHAQWYVDQVLELAALYGQSGPGVSAQTPQAIVFTLDRLQVELEAARAAVSKANEEYLAAAQRARALARREQRIAEQAAAAALLSDRLALQQEAGQVGFLRAAAEADAERLRGVLAAAESALAGIRDEVRAASFNGAVATVLAAPTYQSDYVFPVGGGAQSVSVAHTHHDYPAADVAAPLGAPLYALADGRVLNAWSFPDPSCGIGFTFQTRDGQVWTYCHLSYLEPSVEAGAELPAGAPVGLVGESGDATGPHLHLQLQPPTSYPQDEPWFRSFAGTAFEWNDAPVQEGASILFDPSQVIVRGT